MKRFFSAIFHSFQDSGHFTIRELNVETRADADKEMHSDAYKNDSTFNKTNGVVIEVDVEEKIMDTLAEMRKEKAAITASIHKMLDAFETKYGVIIQDVGISRFGCKNSLGKIALDVRIK